MRLEPLMLLRGYLRTPFTEVGETPFGRRIVADLLSGEFDGSRLRGRLLPSGGDWLLVDRTGMGRLDVRICMQTEDGANIYASYRGLIELDDIVMEALLGGGETRFGQRRFLTTPCFECGDARYMWLNDVIAVAEGRVMTGHGVEYRVFEVTA